MTVETEQVDAPIEFVVTWQENDCGRWGSKESRHPDRSHAVDHAVGLALISKSTDSVRYVAIQQRRAAVSAGEWFVLGWEWVPDGEWPATAFQDR